MISMDGEDDGTEDVTLLALSVIFILLIIRINDSNVDSVNLIKFDDEYSSFETKQSI